MVVSKAAIRYAKSILDLAIEQSKVESVLEDMRLIDSTCKNSNEFSLLLRSPIINAAKKLEIVREIFADKLSEISLLFLEIVIRKGRERILEGIATSFIQQYNVHKGIVSAEVITSFPLTGEIKTKMLTLVKDKTNQEVELKEKIDSSIIGGFILRIGDQQLDESLSSKLLDLRKEFSKNEYIKQL